MYAIYTKRLAPGTRHYTFKSESHIFGCNVGLVPRLLRSHIASSETERSRWHLPVEALLAAQEEAFIINLKPNNPDKRQSLSLYELLDIWGVSDYGWTPAMLRLRGLCVDGKPVIDDPNDILLPVDVAEDPIYSFVYLDGTIKGGKLEGPWTAPRKSSTNSVLLWPYALSYFFESIRTQTPRALDVGTA